MTKTINPMLTRCSALALSTSLALMSGAAQAQSFNANGFVVEGDATITEGAGTTDITVETVSAVIEWAPIDDEFLPFDIQFQDAGTTATFTNGTGISNFAVLNRILPNDVTRRIRFDGNIVSSIQDGLGGSATGGTVFFYSPSGIVIGENAAIDVGNLGLTTADPISDGDGNFIVNDRVDFQQSLSASEIVIDPGAQINALNEGSYVALFSPRILQNGNVAVNGQAALVAGEAGSITFSPDGLFDIEVTIGTDNIGAIEHGGVTGGPASSGVGDNHRAYLVTVAKNNAITLAINGGSELGFDIATGASMDGNVVVLSAGHNIVGGEIGAPTGGLTQDAFIDLSDGDSGLGSGLLFTSAVNARATTGINGFVNTSTIFEDSATFAAGQVNFSVNGAAGGPSSLIVGGDLELIADTPFEADDVGLAFLTVFDASTAQIDGNLVASSRASFDANQDGSVTSNFARVFGDDTAIITVGGDLIVDASVDLTDAFAGPRAQSGNAQVLLQNGASADIGGVTRLISDAFAADGSAATATMANLELRQGGSLTTGELNISADAFGGLDIGAGGGEAVSGEAVISLFDTGTQLTVLDPNTTGSAAGELDFLSSEAFGADGVNGNGGNATSNFTSIFVQLGATIDLPDVVGSPLLIANSAIGGNTSASDSFGGIANLGGVQIQVADGNANLGRLSIRSNGVGGSAIGGAQRTSGGVVFGGQVDINFTNTTASVAFDTLLISYFGGQGTDEDASVAGGSVFASPFTFIVNESTLNLNSDLELIVGANGGSGGTGGQANLNAINFNLFNSDIFAVGDIALLQSATGGAAFAPIVVDPFNGSFDFISGGNAGASNNSIFLTNSTLSAGGEIRVSNNVTGGNAFNGFAGGASSGNTEITLIGTSEISGTDLVIRNQVSGGSIVPGGSGRGGDATAGGSNLIVQEENFGAGGDVGTVTFSGNTDLLSFAIGGNGGDTVFVDPTGFNTQVNQDGGIATSLNGVRVAGFNEGALNFGGNLSVSAAAIGGFAVLGTGGGAIVDRAEIFLEFLDLTVGGDTTVATFATGGNGQVGGAASSNETRLFLREGAGDFLGQTTLAATVTGGDGTVRQGGDATGGFVEANFQNAVVDIDFNEFSSTLTGGQGGQTAGASDTSGGNVSASGINLIAQGSQATFRSSVELDARAVGGDGFSGGQAEGSSALFDLQNSTVSIDGTLNVGIVATGGAALGVGSFDPMNPVVGGVGGSANTQILFFTNDGSTLTATGAIDLSTSAIGGDAIDGDAGSATSGEAFTNFRDASITTAPTINLTSSARGGSVATAAAGNGGNATALRVVHDISAFDPLTGELRPNTDVVINADLNAMTQATGGDAGAFGGNGGEANSNFATLVGNAPGTFLLNGNLDISTTAIGGNASFGTGGAAIAGGAETFASGIDDPMTGVLGPASDITINGSLTLTGTATAGDGATGGAATGALLRISHQNASLTVTGSTDLEARATGGNAFASITPGVGGAATGGIILVNAQSQPGQDPTVVSLADLSILAVSQGGDGGDNLTISDGGQGGEAIGYSANVLARAFDGTLDVAGPANFSFNAIGGDGGNGVNGGAGGLGSARGITIGTVSGASLPDQVNGSAQFTTLTVSNDGAGGTGGTGTTGVGGRGGDGEGNNTTLISRGAPVVANQIVLQSFGQGGAGGSGAVQGDGGYGLGGFLSVILSQAFENPGRGSSDIGSLSLISSGLGGAGAMPGQNFFARGADLEFTQTDVTIDTLDLQLLGDESVEALFPVEPLSLNFAGATLTSNTISIVTPGEVSTSLSSSLITADTFSIVGATLLLPEPDPDPMAPPPDPNRGNITVTDQIALTATEGDLEIDAELAAGTEIILNAPGNITAGTLITPTVFLETLMGTISTGDVTTNGGAISIQASETLDLQDAFATTDANSITARSLNGDVVSTAPLSLSGDVVIEAAQSIAIDDLTAGSITATALAGDISTGALVGTSGPIILDAANSITFTRATANQILATTNSGDITSTDTVDGASTSFVAGGSINLDGVLGGTVDLTALTGDISLGLVDISDTITVDAANAITLSVVEANGLIARSGAGGITSSGRITAGGDVDVEADGLIDLDSVTSQSSIRIQSFNDEIRTDDLRAINGGINLDAALSITSVDVDAPTIVALSGAAISFADVTGQSILIDTRSSDVAVNAVNAAGGDVTLLGQDVAFTSIDADTLNITGARSIDGSGPINATGAFTAASVFSVNLGDVNAESITIDSAITPNFGEISTGSLNATQDLTLTANNSIMTGSLSARDAGLTVLTGDINVSDLIDLTGALNAQASGSINVAVVNAQSITATATTGGLTNGLLNSIEDVNLTSADSIDLGGIAADSITATSTAGDITATQLIDLVGDLDLEAFASVLLSDVTAQSIAINALNGGVQTGFLTAATGAVALTAEDSIIVAGAAANTLTAATTNGDVTNNGTITLTGAFDAQSAGSVFLNDVTAQTITANALGQTSAFDGGLSARNLSAIDGTVTLAAALSISIQDSLTAGSLNATSGNVINLFGDTTLTGAIDLDAVGEINLGAVSAQSLTVDSSADDVIFGGLTTVDGAIAVNAFGIVFIEQNANVEAGSFTLVAPNGGASINAPITLTGDFNVEAAGIGVFAPITSMGDLTIETTGLVNATDATFDARSISFTSSNAQLGLGTLTATESVTLEAATFVTVGDVSGETITATALDGALTTGVLEAATSVTLEATDSIALTGINANSIIATSSAGDVASNGLIEAQDAVTVEAAGAVALDAVNANALVARASDGDVSATGPITLNGLLDAEASGSVNLGAVTAGAIDAQAVGGSINAGAIDGLNGDVSLNAANSVALTSLSAGSLTGSAGTGDFTATDLVSLSGALDVSAGGVVNLANVNTGAFVAQSDQTLTLGGFIGDSFVARSTGGDIITTGAIILTGLFDAEASGSLVLDDITAGTINARALGGSITASALDGLDGLITLEAVTSIALTSLTGGTLMGNAGAGDFTASDLIALSETLEINAGGLVDLANVNTGTFDATAGQSLILGSITAQRIDAQAMDGSITAAALDGMDGIVTLEANSIALGSLSGSSLVGNASMGDFTASDLIALSDTLTVNAGGLVDLANVNAGTFDATAGQSLILGSVTAQSVVGRSTLGDIAATSLIVDNGAVDLEAAMGIALTNITADTLVARALGGDISVIDAVALIGAFDAEAFGSLALADVTAGSITATAINGGVAFDALTGTTGAVTLEAAESIALTNITGNGVTVRSLGGDVTSVTPIDTAGAFIVEAAGSVGVDAVTAVSIFARAQGGDITATGDLTALGGAVDLEASNSLALVGVIADTFQGRALGGDFASTGLMDLSGLLDIEAAQSIALADVDAGTIAARSLGGDVTGTGTTSSQGTADFSAAGALFLGDVTAGRITTVSQGATQVGGQWAAPLIEVTTPLLEFLGNGSLNAGINGTIAITFTNGTGLLVGEDDEAGVDVLELTEEVLALIEGGDVTVAASANVDGPDIVIGALDTSSANGIGSLRFSTTDPMGEIRVTGAVTSGSAQGPQELAFRSGRFTLDTEIASIDLSPSGGSLAISADVILVGNGALIDSTTGDETPDALLEAFNAAPTEAVTEAAAALIANAITLEGGRAILIQNSGTEEAPAGFVISSAEGLELSGRIAEDGTTSRPLVVINGQIDEGGVTITGNEAGTAVLEAIGDTSDLGALSQINGCELGGCVASDQGEITSDVSAQVNGVVDSGGSGAGASGSGDSSGGSASGGDSSAGDGSGGDSGGADEGTTSDDGSSDEGGEDGSEETDDGSAGANAGNTDTGSNSGGDGNPDNADDGGGGNDDFVIEENSGDDSNGGDGSDDGASGSDDSGSDGDASDDGASDDGSSDGDSSDEGGDDTESGDEESDGSDDDSDGDEADDSEESDDTEEADEEESDEEESEDEEEEEESSEEEEEDSEGPATGPIAPPPALIDTNTLERNTVIDDPISGTGNPALLDPDIAVSDPSPPPATEDGGSQ